MVKLSITKLAEMIAVKEKGNYYICLVDSKIEVLSKPKGIVMFPFVKYSNDTNKIRKDLYNSMNRISICEEELFEEYLEIEGYVANSKAPLLIRYNNNNNSWCSVSKIRR